MPRRSDASLSVVVVNAPQRQAPPLSLSEAEAGIWESIMASLPADWFRPSDWPILAAYCQTAVQYEEATTQMREQPLTLMGERRRIYKHPLLAIQHTTTLRLALLASKLRLCPSSRVRIDATGAASKVQPAKKPWDAQ
ncbi:MAG: phage terminase small subunit P27 family [Alphaproteobacteria bacterium]|nr:phage terminase small subunit P27 family [Alphaproteobacteria bacterium]